MAEMRYQSVVACDEVHRFDALPPACVGSRGCFTCCSMPCHHVNIPLAPGWNAWNACGMEWCQGDGRCRNHLIHAEQDTMKWCAAGSLAIGRNLRRSTQPRKWHNEGQKWWGGWIGWWLVGGWIGWSNDI